MLKLGRLPRSHDPAVPQLDTLRRTLLKTSQAPGAVVQANWLQKIRPADLGMMLNDQYGCCVEAGSFHAIQVLSSFMNRDGLEITEPDACVLQAYREVTGFDPSDPATDQGTDMQAYLKHWLNVGLPTGPGAQSRHRCVAFVEINPKNHQDVVEVIARCGFAYLGFEVPAYIMGPDGASPLADWVYPDPSGASEASTGGHCVIAAAADPLGVTVISWGGVYKMSWRFWDRFVDEAYAVVDPDWANQHGTPLGISLGALAAEMKPLAAPASAG
jgi:hypothetical protein